MVEIHFVPVDAAARIALREAYQRAVLALAEHNARQAAGAPEQPEPPIPFNKDEEAA